jgi:chondroitin sulfate proteoglycan 4
LASQHQSQQTIADVLAIVLVEGRVKLLLDRGNGLQEVVSDRLVADGKWHAVQVSVTPGFARVQVDGVHVSSNQSEAGSNK